MKGEKKKLIRRISIDFHDIGITVSATLLEEEEPELCNEFWNSLVKPVKMACDHNLSTGDSFVARGRPPRHPVRVGSQANPRGRKQWLLCRLSPGMLLYAGGYSIGMAYGPDMTEPLAGGGSVVAKVDKKDLNNLMKAGKSIWHAQSMTHRLAIITVSREGGKTYGKEME